MSLSLFLFIFNSLYIFFVRDLCFIDMSLKSVKHSLRIRNEVTLGNGNLSHKEPNSVTI